MSKIKVIGTSNCSRCSTVKNILNSKNIEFDYLVIDNMNEEDSTSYMDMAKTANVRNFPLIIKDNKIINLNEI
jgi:glutaredoxin